MSYSAIAQAAQDPALRDRIAACVATQTTAGHPINIVAAWPTSAPA